MAVGKKSGKETAADGFVLFPFSRVPGSVLRLSFPVCLFAVPPRDVQISP
jgi:hypothetical protein